MLEIACFNSSSAILAAQAGADRIELCDDYSVGGLTPSVSSLQQIRSSSEANEICASIPVNIMIRPRAEDFCYNEAEYSQMKASIHEFKHSGVDLKPSGFVFGILSSMRTVDVVRNTTLVRLAAPLPCTFHRAIDEVGDMLEAVEDIVACGFTSILTSGGMKNAADGVEKVAQLQKKFGGRIKIVLGGGVRNTNVGELISKTQIPWVHSAAITGVEQNINVEEVKKLVQIVRGSK